MYVVAIKHHSIHFIRVGMVVRTGIKSKHILKIGNLGIGELFGNLCANINNEAMQGMSVYKATSGIRVSICIYYIRLDLVYRGAIHEVCPKHM